MARWTRFVLGFRWPILGFWLVVLLVGGFATSKLTPLLSNTFTVPGTDSERARTILQKHFGDRSDGEFLVIYEIRNGTAGVRLKLERSIREAATAVPGGKATALRDAPGGVVYGSILTTLNLAEAKGYTDDIRDRLHTPQAVAGYVSGQPAIEGDLDPDCADGVARCLRAVVRRDDSVSVRGRDDHRHARDRLHLRPLPDDGDLRHEPRPADRPRDRNRLLPADRLPLPRGAGEGRLEGRRHRPHDGDGGTCGDLLRRHGCDRACAPPLHAAPVHALDGCRRLPHPAGLDRRRRNAATGLAVAVRRPRDEAGARGRLAARSRPPLAALCGQGRRARLLGATGTRDHASAAGLLRCGCRATDRRSDSRLRIAADAWIGAGHPPDTAVRAGAQRPARRGRAGSVVADADRARRRQGGRRSLAGDPGRHSAPSGRPRGRSRGRVRAERPESSLRRLERALRAAHRCRQARIRRRALAALRRPPPRHDRP